MKKTGFITALALTSLLIYLVFSSLNQETVKILESSLKEEPDRTIIEGRLKNRLKENIDALLVEASFYGVNHNCLGTASTILKSLKPKEVRGFRLESKVFPGMENYSLKVKAEGEFVNPYGN